HPGVAVEREHLMSESQRTTVSESPFAQRLSKIDPQQLHAWLMRAASLSRDDLMRSWSAAVSPSPEPDLDLEAFLDWCAAGIELFAREGLPSRRAIDDAAHRVMLAAVLRRYTSISAAAAALETSRRALRAAMKRLGLYDPWKHWRAQLTVTLAKTRGRQGSSAVGESLGTTETPSEG